MDALISGSNGRALLLDAGSLKSFDEDDPSRLVPRVPADLAYLFGEMQDLRFLENTDIESIQQELKHESDSTVALDLTLISLDAELPDDIRKEAIAGLDELLKDSRVVKRVEEALYAHPLPEDGDLTGAIQLSKEVQSLMVAEMLERFEDRQTSITEVSEAWDAIPGKTFGDDERREAFQHQAVREGLFRRLVILQETQTPERLMIEAGLNAAITRLPNYRQVLQRWVSPFRQATEARKITHELDDESKGEITPRRHRGRRVGFDRNAVLTEVTRRKAIITSAIASRDLQRVHGLVDDLVRYQLENGEPEHAAKSLCDLAMEAKDLGMFALQLELTERSVGIAPADGWSWAQYGDALLRTQRLDEALWAFDQAVGFRDDAVGNVGRAEVLKAQGKLPLALAAFDEVIAAHPEEVVAKNGRAEVLRAQGRLPDAFAAFDKIIKAHPENVVAKNGRAEVLKAQGRLPDALAAFNEIIEAHPEDVVAKNGRAEVLKAMNDLDAALVAYDEVRLRHPENTSARNGRSCVLAALGRYEESLKDLPEHNPIGKNDWIGYHIRGMILLRVGKLSEALQILSEGAQNDPLPLSREFFRNALAVAWLRGREYGKASQALAEVNSPLLQPLANVLRIHAFGAQGQQPQALAAYENLAYNPAIRSDELTQELRHQFILREVPRQDEEWIIDREVRILLLAA